MENEFIYLNYHHRKSLEHIIEQLLLSLSDCHYLYNIKSSEFKHRVSGLENHIVTFRSYYLNRHNSLKYVGLLHMTFSVKELLSVFTVGGHQLEVRIFNSIFYCEHQLIALAESIKKDIELT